MKGARNKTQRHLSSENELGYYNYIYYLRNIIQCLTETLVVICIQHTKTNQLPDLNLKLL